MSAPEQQLKPIDYSLPIEIDCVDDQGYQNGKQNVKTAASPFGLSQDTSAARWLRSDGRFGAEIPVGPQAKVLTVGLGRFGLESTLHQNCGGEQGAQAIGDQIVNNGELILRKMNRILGGSVNESTFEQLQQFYARLYSDPLLYRGVDIEAATMTRADELPAIERSPLAHTDGHRASKIRVNTTPDTWFDAAEAYANGEPYYHYDLWAVEPIAEKIDTIIPHDNVEGFVIASVARIVATSRVLPNPDKNRTGIDIVIANA